MTIRGLLLRVVIVDLVVTVFLLMAAGWVAAWAATEKTRSRSGGRSADAKSRHGFLSLERGSGEQPRSFDRLRVKP